MEIGELPHACIDVHADRAIPVREISAAGWVSRTRIGVALVSLTGAGVPPAGEERCRFSICMRCEMDTVFAASEL